MANPPIFQPGFNYSNWQATNPVKPLPAQQVDNDFANVGRSVNQAISAIGDVRRSDGKLKNGIVGPDALAPQFSIGFSFEGNWAADQQYQAGDGVVFSQVFYAARVSHTSSVANQPPDSGTWTLLFSLDDIVVTGALSMPAATFLSDGVTTDFNLGFAPLSNHNVFVTIGGQIQDPSEYSVNGNTLTFVTAPPTGPLGEAYTITARGFATTATLTTPADGSVTEPKLAPAVASKLNGAMQSGVYDLRSLGLDIFDHGNFCDAREFGVIPGTGADMRANLQAAITYAATNGKRLRIRKGLYLISSAIKQPDYSDVEGSGYDCIIKLTDASAYVNHGWTNTNNTGSELTNTTPNRFIRLANIAIDGNGQRAGSGTYGCAHQLSYVENFLLKNVKAINGVLHCIDIAAARTSTGGNGYVDPAASAQTLTPGPSRFGVLDNCIAENPLYDDAITTHYSSDLLLINPISRMTGGAVPDSSSQGLEIDDGCRRITVLGGYASGFTKGVQIKGHNTVAAAREIVVRDFVSEGNLYNYDIQHNGGGVLGTAYDVLLAGCRSIRPVFTNAAYTQVRHMEARDYDGLCVSDFVAEGDPAVTLGGAKPGGGVYADKDVGNIKLYSGLDNAVFKSISIKDSGRTAGSIEAQGTAGSSIKLVDVNARNCYGGPVVYADVGIRIMSLRGNLDVTTTPNLGLVQLSNVAASAGETLIEDVDGNAGYTHGIINDDGVNGIAVPKGRARFGNGVTDWRQSNSASGVAGPIQYIRSIGLTSGNQNLGVNERFAYAWRVRVKDTTETVVLADAAERSSATDGTLTHNRVFLMYDGATLVDVAKMGFDYSLDMLTTAGAYKVNGTKVVGTRKTGWAADASTAKRTANASYSATVASAAYTQAEITALMVQMTALSGTIRALKDDLISHGLIGA